MQTKQMLSQLQVESLNILAMSMTELKDFLQNEEIENPIVEYTNGSGEEAAPVTFKETERFYNGSDREDSRENELYEIEDSEKSLEDLVNMQLQWKHMGDTERKIVDFCIQSLDQSGYLTIPPQEIAKNLGVTEEQVMRVLPIMSSPKVLILRAFSLNITSQNRAKGVRQSSYPVLNSYKRVQLIKRPGKGAF